MQEQPVSEVLLTTMLWLTRDTWTYGHHSRDNWEVTLASPRFHPRVQRKTNQEENLQTNQEKPQTFPPKLSSCTCREHLEKPAVTNCNQQLSLTPPSRALTPGAAALGCNLRATTAKWAAQGWTGESALHKALAPHLPPLEHDTALGLGKAGSATYSAGHRNHPARYTCTPDENQIMLAQRTLTVLS